MTRAELEINKEFTKYEKEKNKVAIESFMRAIRYQVVKSRELTEGNGGFNIRRGMAHAIAGYCEDLFALYVAKYVGNTEVKYFVDKVIKTKFEHEEKSKTFKPDLAIVDENNVLTHYFDLKTNLGWNRNMESFLKEKNTLIENLIENKKATITSKKDWLNKMDSHGNINLINTVYEAEKKLDIKISEKLKYHIVVVFGGNIGKEAMKKNSIILNNNNLDHIEFSILKPKDDELYDIEAFNKIHESLSILISKKSKVEPKRI